MHVARSCPQSLSHIWSCVPPWTVAHQAPLSMGLSQQQYWSGLLFSPPGDLPDPGIKPTSPMSSALADGFFYPEPSGKPTWKSMDSSKDSRRQKESSLSIDYKCVVKIKAQIFRVTKAMSADIRMLKNTVSGKKKKISLKLGIVEGCETNEINM